MYIAIIQLCLFTFYITYVWRKFGIQKSLSESWYVVKEKWMFTVILCFGVGILHSTHGTSLFFFSGAMLCFTGVASDFRRAKSTRIIHYFGATASIFLSLLQLGLLGIWWPLEICIILGAPILLTENKFWWMEIVAFYSILGGIIQLKY